MLYRPLVEMSTSYSFFKIYLNHSKIALHYRWTTVKLGFSDGATVFCWQIFFFFNKGKRYIVISILTNFEISAKNSRKKYATKPKCTGQRQEVLDTVSINNSWTHAFVVAVRVPHYFKGSSSVDCLDFHSIISSSVELLWVPHCLYGFQLCWNASSSTLLYGFQSQNFRWQNGKVWFLIRLHLKVTLLRRIEESSSRWSQNF